MTESNLPPVDPARFTASNHPALHYERMLADQPRMIRYRQAIEAVVRPGDIVADLGTGLGVLALMALGAGAKRVYAIDVRPRALWMAERVIRANGGAEDVTLIAGDARDITLPEPVDCIVNELIGDFGTDEGIHETVAAFARRNLGAQGRVVPSRLSTHLVPVQYADEFRGIWRAGYHGLDLGAAIDFPCRGEAVMHPVRQPALELAAAATISDVEFGSAMGARDCAPTVEFETTADGILQGFIGYFVATLCDGVTLSNYPGYDTCHWETWNWPVHPPRAIGPGRRIRATLEQPDRVTAASWKMEWAID